MYFHLFRSEQRLSFAQGVIHADIVLDQHDLACAPRCRFEAKSPTAREQVQTVFPGQILAQPIEQRLAQSIWRRSQGLRLGKTHQTAAPQAADDAHLTSLHDAKTLLEMQGRLPRPPR